MLHMKEGYSFALSCRVQVCNNGKDDARIYTVGLID